MKKQLLLNFLITTFLVFLVILAVPQDTVTLYLSKIVLSYLFLYPIIIIGNPSLQLRVDQKYVWIAPIYTVIIPVLILIVFTGEILYIDRIVIWYLLPCIILLTPKKINEVYHKIGFMPQELSLYLDLTVEQNLKFFGFLYKMPKPILHSRIQELLKLINLTDFKKRLISKCSGGMQRRCSLAVALLHKPEILILDEPTVGIDPELRIEFWNYFGS